MPRLFHHSLHFEYKLFPKGMKTLYLAHLLRGMSEQLTGLFIPIFLFTMGKSHAFWSFFPNLSSLQRGIFTVCVFYFVVRFFMLFIVIPISRVPKKIGLTKTMILGNVFQAMFYASLFLSQKDQRFLFLAMAFQAIEMSLYWPSYLTQFALRADLRSIGRDVGSITFLDKLVRALIPIVGGTLITFFGFGAGQLISITMLFASISLLLATQETICSYVVTFSEFFQWIKRKDFQKCSLGFFGKYIDDGAFVLWSIYALIFFGTIERVGFVFSCVLFISLTLSYFMGWYLGKHKGKMLLFLSGGTLSALWILRMFVQSIWHFIFVDVIDKLAISVYQPIFDTLFLRKSREKAAFHFLVYREVIISFSALFFWLIVFLCFALPLQWFGLFVFGSFGVLLSLLMHWSSTYE